MGRVLLVVVLAAMCACKGKNRYEELARKANSSRTDAGEVVMPAPKEATLVAGMQNGPRKIFADGDALYWLDDGSRGEGKSGIMKASKSGGDVKPLVEGEGIFDFALDSSNVYFVAPRSGKVFKVAKSGGEPVSLADTGGMIRGVIVDDKDVFWPENEGIYKVSKEPGGKIQQIVKEIVSPDYLTADDANLYWYSSLSGNVYRASKKGGTPSKIYSNDKNTLHTIFGEGNDLYVTFGSIGKMEIHRLGKSGGTTKLGAGFNPGSDYATDSNFVYWATEEALFKMPRNGGSATEIVSKTDRARNITVDSSSVFWTDRGGRVQKMPK